MKLAKSLFRLPCSLNKNKLYIFALSSSAGIFFFCMQDTMSMLNMWHGQHMGTLLGFSSMKWIIFVVICLLTSWIPRHSVMNSGPDGIWGDNCKCSLKVVRMETWWNRCVVTVISSDQGEDQQNINLESCFQYKQNWAPKEVCKLTTYCIYYLSFCCVCLAMGTKMWLNFGDFIYGKPILLHYKTP